MDAQPRGVAAVSTRLFHHVQAVLTPAFGHQLYALKLGAESLDLDMLLLDAVAQCGELQIV